jgi:hypothetical protein
VSQQLTSVRTRNMLRDIEAVANPSPLLLCYKPQQ